MLRKVLRLLDRSTRRKLFLSFAATLALATLEMIGIALTLPVIRILTQGAAQDDVFVALLDRRLGISDEGHLLAVLGTAVFLAFLIKGLASVWILSRNFGFLLRREAQVATQLLDAYMRAPYTFHLQRNTAESLHRIEVCTSVLFSQVVTSILAVGAEAAVIFGILVILVTLQPLMAVVALGYFALLAVAYQRVLHVRAASAGEVVHHGTRSAYQLVTDSLGAAKEVMVRGRQHHFVEKFSVAKNQIVSSKQSLSVLAQLPRYYLETALIVGVGVMSVVLVAVEGRASAVAGLGLFLVAGFRLLPSMQRLLVSSSAIRSGQAVLDAVHSDFVELDIEPVAMLSPLKKTAREVPTSFTSSLSFDRISYRYPGTSTNVLTDVSFGVRRGTAVGLVGPSGAGKTTLIDLALGLLTPTGGAITVDGRPLGTIVESWQRLVGYVPQDIYLLDDTVSANIALGWSPEQADNDALAEAIASAQLGDVIAELPYGINTVLGERGLRLSGGQQQRIGIARALYVRPEVLVLDEATSALDAQTERTITQTIEGLRGKITMLVVAHRLSTVRGCDQLIYVRDGRVLAAGTFDELVTKVPDFARAVELGDLGYVEAKRNPSP